MSASPTAEQGIRLGEKPILTLAAARAIAAAAEAEATRNGWSMSIAVLDDGGHLLHFFRMDTIHVATVEVAIAKAKSAVMFKRPTKVFAEGLAGGTIGFLALPDVTPFEGGIPLVTGGQVIGAIGVSGGAPISDGQVAAAGASVLATIGK